MKNKFYFDKSIPDLLSIIAALDPMLGPIEMIELWNDLYHEEFDGFIQCFSDKQLGALKEFNSTYRPLIAELPTDPDFYRDSRWIKISVAAQKALCAFNS